MTANPFFSVNELPAKPDSRTGQPPPPRAPGFANDEERITSRDKDRAGNPTQAPAPPQGEGPTLVWYRPSQYAQAMSALGAFAVQSALVVPIVIVARTQGVDLRWGAIGVAWAVIVVISLLVAGAVRKSACAVGAEWLQVSKRHWVRLYELTKITGSYYNAKLHLELTDRDGRCLNAEVADLQKDRRMWDIVYNGILHSVIAGGADADEVRGALAIPYPQPQKEQ